MSRNFPKILGLLTFPVIFLFSMVAFGQPCPDVDVQVVNEAVAQQEWWMVLLDALLQLVAPIVIGVLGTLASIAIRKWGKKLDVDTQDRFIGLTQNLISSGVAFAEEQGRKALKVGEAQTDGARKLQHAVDYIQEQLEESRLPQMGTEKLERLIESRLHAERANPTGSVPSDPSDPENVYTIELPVESTTAETTPEPEQTDEE